MEYVVYVEDNGYTRVFSTEEEAFAHVDDLAINGIYAEVYIYDPSKK